MKRRDFVGLAASLGAIGSAKPGSAHDVDPYPSRPVRIVVGFPAGQASDVMARLLAAKLTEDFKQSVIVDNKPGAAGIIAHESVKNAKPDGYTLMIGSTATLAINPALHRHLGYDPLKDFAPVALLNTTPMYLAVNPDLGVANLRELVDYARARPGQLSYASAGSGTSSHIVMEMLKTRTGMDLTHVPFKGSPGALASVESGDTPLGFEISSVIIPHATTGRVKLLATSAADRTRQFPDVPTLVEEGLSGFVFTPWSAMLVPSATSVEVVGKLNGAVNRALQQQDLQTYFASSGSVARGGTPATLQAFIRDEMTVWGDAVRASGAQAE